MLGRKKVVLRRILCATTGLAVASGLLLFSAGKAHATTVLDPDVYITVSGGAPASFSAPTGTSSNGFYSVPIPIVDLPSYGPTPSVDGIGINDLSVSYSNTSKSQEYLSFSLAGLKNYTNQDITISLYVSASNFSGPGGAFKLTGSGTEFEPTSTTANLSWYADPNDGLGANSAALLPGSNVDNAYVPSGGGDSYSTNLSDSGNGADNGNLFSMTELMYFTSCSRRAARFQLDRDANHRRSRAWLSAAAWHGHARHWFGPSH